MTPIWRVLPSRPKWERIRDRPGIDSSDGQFILSFCHRFTEGKGGGGGGGGGFATFFAFRYPWFYTECHVKLSNLGSVQGNSRSKALSPSTSTSNIQNFSSTLVIFLAFGLEHFRLYIHWSFLSGIFPGS